MPSRIKYIYPASTIEAPVGWSATSGTSSAHLDLDDPQPGRLDGKTATFSRFSSFDDALYAEKHVSEGPSSLRADVYVFKPLKLGLGSLPTGGAGPILVHLRYSALGRGSIPSGARYSRLIAISLADPDHPGKSVYGKYTFHCEPFLHLPGKSSWVTKPEKRYSPVLTVPRSPDLGHLAGRFFSSRHNPMFEPDKRAGFVKAAGDIWHVWNSAAMSLVDEESAWGQSAELWIYPVIELWHEDPSARDKMRRGWWSEPSISVDAAFLSYTASVAEALQDLSLSLKGTVYASWRRGEILGVVTPDISASLVGAFTKVDSYVSLSFTADPRGDGARKEESLGGVSVSDSGWVQDFGSGGGGSADGSGGVGVGFTASVRTPSGGGGSQPSLVERNVDQVGCRACGDFARVSENLIIMSDGLYGLLEVNPQAGSAKTITGAPALPTVAASRGRVWAFGTAQTVRKSATVTAGSAEISLTSQAEASWEGRYISVKGVTFGGRCQTRIASVGGSTVVVTDSPDNDASGAPFVVWEDKPPELRWSDLNDHTSWPDANKHTVPLTTEQAPTALFSVDDFLVLCTSGRAIRFDWGRDPAEDYAFVTITDTRGCVGPRAGVVVEGTLYCLGKQYPYVWATRGGRMFSLPLGDPIAPLIEPGGRLELDWDNAWCWFAWYSPRSNSVCFAVSTPGNDLPNLVLEYLKPSSEGSGEPGRWSIRSYPYRLQAADYVIGPSGEQMPVLAVSPAWNRDLVYLVSDDGTWADMSMSAPMEGQVKSFDAGLITFESRLPRAPEVPEPVILLRRDGSYELSTVRSGDRTSVVLDPYLFVSPGDKVLFSWQPPVTFETIHVSPDPPWGRVRIEQVYAHWTPDSAESILRLEALSERGDQKVRTWTGAGPEGVQLFDEIAAAGSGVEGYSCRVRVTLIAKSRPSYVHFLDVIRRKFYEFPLGTPSDG